MKKKSLCPGPGCRKIIHFLLMKASFIFLLLLTMQMKANVYAQQLRMDLDLRNVSLKEVMKEIRRNSDFSFVYSDVDLMGVSQCNVQLKNATVDDILKNCLQGTGLKYDIADKTIIIRKMETVVQDKKSFVIQGFVTDSRGNPLPGVTVMIKGTQLGISTDVDGIFRIELPEMKNVVLAFSFIGMKPMELKYAGQGNIRVKMEEEVAEIDEVVVTGIFKKSRESYTGSVSTVTEKELKAFRGRNLLSTLKNIDPTFNIIENNLYGADPNHLPEVQIRGTSSLPTVEDLKNDTKVDLNTPLIIMDGFKISLTRMLDLNDEDISSVTLLKDGSATAIYGSRGANGVIVIETKKPEAGKLRLSYRGSVNIEAPDLSDYEVLNAEEKLKLEKEAGLYKNEWPWFEMELRERATRIQEEVARGVNTYWLSKPLRTGVGHKHNLRLEGGGDSGFRYAASVQYNDIAGVMKGSDRQTFNGNVNLVYQHEKLLFRNNLEIGLGESNESPYGTFDQYVKLNPYWTGYDKNGKVLKMMEEEKAQFWDVIPENPLYNATLDLVDKKTYTTITNNFDVEWKPWDGFILRSGIGLTKQMNNYDNFKPADHTKYKDYSKSEVFRKGEYVYSSGKSFSYEWNVTLSYSKTFAEKHVLYAGLDYNVAQDNASSYTFTVEGFPQSNLKFLSMALQYEKDGKPTGTESFNRRIGLTGNANYIYDNRYFADFAYRVDGASQFGSSRRFAPFYSAGIGWNIHQEKFMENLEWLNRLKLRGSYAVTGSVNFDAYQALATYKYYLDDRYRNWFGSYLMGLANKDLEWQKTKKWDVGLEAGLFNNRLKLVADVYINKTNNLLSEMNLPLTNGFSSYKDNVGIVKNNGVELSLSGYLIRNTGKNMIWSLSGSFIYEKNEIVKISEALKVANQELELAGGTNPNFMYREGEALRTIYVVPSLGIDPSTGKEMFINRFGEVTYDWDARDKVACGVSDPKYRGNINTMFTYRDLSLNLSFGYRLGGYQYNQTLIDRVENADLHYNVDRRVYEDRWMKPGDHTFFKDIKDTGVTQMSSRFVQKENTLECQSIQLKYDFSQQWVKQHLGTQYLSLAFSTDNLFRVSSIKQERGIMYPFSRRYTLSLSATF